MGHVQVSRLIPASQGDLYRYLVDLGNLNQWLDLSMEAELTGSLRTLREHSEFSIKFTRYGRTVDSVFRVDELKPQETFAYRQVKGFFKSWLHTQILSLHDAKTTLVTDVVEFQMPYGILGALADDLFVRADVERLLHHRLLKTEERFTGPS